MTSALYEGGFRLAYDVMDDQRMAGLPVCEKHIVGNQ